MFATNVSAVEHAQDRDAALHDRLIRGKAEAVCSDPAATGRCEYFHLFTGCIIWGRHWTAAEVW